ncbi:MAG: paraquat-inducible protein A [Marinobacterium sp.]|nr:paraquat-inducible protein A [Marinobacterium sp.]
MNDLFFITHTACHSCDLLIRLPQLTPGEKALCPRCGHMIEHNITHGPALSLSFAISALIFMVLSLQFPFLAFEAQGQTQQMTLLQSATELAALNYLPLALLLVLFILPLPTLVLTLLCLALTKQMLGVATHWQKRYLQWLTMLEPWCMVEVFLIGILVSLIKISAMADIILGISFWAYVFFTLCMTASLACLDKRQFWQSLGDRTDV